jgi:2,3-dihydroxybenzoate-AMP ligase
VLAGIVGWPEEFATRYRREGYWRDQSFGDLLRGWAETHSERTAVVGGEQRLTYRELDGRATRLATGLLRLGIRPQDVVVVQLPNVPEFVVLCFALFRIGALPILALPGLRGSEIRQLIELAKAVAYFIVGSWQRFDYRELACKLRFDCPSMRNVIVVGDPGGFTAFETLDDEPGPLPSVRASDVALFQLSGGTTGLPKLIPRTHEEYAYSARASAELCELNSSSSYMAVLPAAHNFTMSSPGILGTLQAGGKVVLATTGDAEDAFALIEREQVTITAVVPPLALMWMDSARRNRCDRSSLRVLQVGGAKLGAEAASCVGPVLGCQLQQVFGMAEGLVNYTRLNDPLEVRVNTQGRPLSPADEIRVVDDEDRDLPTGSSGHLLVRGPYTIRGYWPADEHNRRAFTADGFYRTGDIVRLTTAGNLTVEGRSKDLINRGGDKISAEELENHLFVHPAIRQVAAVSMPDEFLGERTCVYVVPRMQSPSLEELRRFVRQRGLAEFKLPDRLELVDTFPETSLGKVNKQKLREQIATKISQERVARSSRDVPSGGSALDISLLRT